MLLLGTLVALLSPLAAADYETMATAVNPDPAHLPSLSVVNDSAFARPRTLTMLRATFPDVPGFTCESWCYESPVTFVSARGLEGGKLELTHRIDASPDYLWITVATPLPGAVDVEARVVKAPGAPPDGPPPSVFAPNLCWQLRRAETFCSQPDPYPGFIKRCFIYTPQGRTFLDHTERRKIPCRAADDAYNNPPWVQSYCGVWQAVPTVGPTAWADFSPDRYTTPICGTVSRDGKWLAALANGSASMLAQAWHDCLHNNPPWLPADGAWDAKRWHVRIYLMENDPQKLLERVVADFPDAKPRG
ncbi:MAG: hypothetical protein HYU66_13435 [Armatimonadetes bacterium]|nr:hypothetical protein [Armatimonadota bacterium]